MRMRPTFFSLGLCVGAAAALALLASCAEDEAPLAPYEGSGRVINAITVETGTLTPRITWVGGYVTIVGVNKGRQVALDSTLVWLLHASGDAVRYPVTFGTVPAGAQEISSTYGGTPIARLREDEVYTVWVLKANAWAEISSQPGKQLRVDSVSSSIVVNRNDTLYVNPSAHAQYSDTVDLYTNVYNINQRSSFATFTLQETDTSDNIIIRWRVTQSGVTDTLLTAMGLVAAAQYSVNDVVWEVVSREQAGDSAVYWSKNVIRGPVLAGESFAGTETFVSLPATGIERGKAYYLWIAQKDWDQVRRDRFAPYYAFITFNTR